MDNLMPTEWAQQLGVDEAMLESLWLVTEAANWMTFEEFEEMVGNSDRRDAVGILALFNHTVH